MCRLRHQHLFSMYLWGREDKCIYCRASNLKSNNRKEKQKMKQNEIKWKKNRQIRRTFFLMNLFSFNFSIKLNCFSLHQIVAVSHIIIIRLQGLLMCKNALNIAFRLNSYLYYLVVVVFPMNRSIFDYSIILLYWELLKKNE